MRATFLGLAVVLAGCATIPQFQVVGPCAGKLTPKDIREIVALIRPDNDLNHLYTRIDAVRPDKAEVKWGGYGRRNGVLTDEPAADFFTAWKRHGKWTSDGSAGIERSITVY